jgi:glycosyltransferase involved in cell wall biosynthesis
VAQTPAGPVVTVVTPTFRRPDTLPLALESALAQTYPHFELVVSDNDCSPSVRALVEGYGDPRLHYRDNGRNIGASANARAAYRDACARTPFVATLHDDDLWEPSFLERLVPPLLEDPTLTLAFSDHWLMAADGAIDEALNEDYARLWRRDRLPEGRHQPFGRLALVDRSVPIAMSAVMRASALDLDDWPDGVDTNYDIWLAYQLCRDGGAAWYSRERLTRVRAHAGAITATKRYDEALVFLYGRFAADPRLASLRPALLEEGARFETGWGLELLAQGRRSEALGHLWRGARRRPGPRSLVGLALGCAPTSSSLVLRLRDRRSGRKPSLVRY